MRIDYTNMPKGANKSNFIFRYIFNIIRTWYYFNIKFPNVKYNGFVRIMKRTHFAKRKIILGKNVQFGRECEISTDLIVGDNVLFASRVSIIGKNDHDFRTVGKTIWEGSRNDDGVTIIQDDVWIGYGSIIIGGVTVETGSIVSAGSVVVDNIPPCEIWGGVPAKRIRCRFEKEELINEHIARINLKN